MASLFWKISPLDRECQASIIFSVKILTKDCISYDTLYGLEAVFPFYLFALIVRAPMIKYSTSGNFVTRIYMPYKYKPYTLDKYTLIF